MSNQEKAPSAGTPEAVQSPETNHDNQRPCTQSLPRTEVSRKRIMSLISYGEDNAIHLSDLVRITGVDERLLRKCIESIRRSGIVIAASDQGYFLPDNLGELRSYRAREEHRAESILLTLKATREMEAVFEEENNLCNQITSR